MATPAILQEVPASAPSTKPPRPQRLWLHLLLFVVTAFTTTAVGMRYMDNFRHGLFPIATDADLFPYDWVYHHLSQLTLGLPFSATLLAILLTHEFGHYFACRAYKIKATLPYLLPAPSLSGTAGAVIRLRSRVKSRSALMAIGAFGPLSGFVVAIVMATIGLKLSLPTATEPTRLVTLHLPLLIRLLAHLTSTTPFLAGHVLWHPIFVASWVGILITSLNLIPAGQLDGGHVLYAISPTIHRYTTYAMLGVLVYLGIWHWIGWLIWTALLLLPGMRHPKVSDPTPPRAALLALAPACLVLLVLCATPEPFGNASLLHLIHRFKS